MPSTTHQNDARKAEAIDIRMPDRSDAVAVWRLVGACPPLDLNSSYCYLLLCSHLRETCAVAEAPGLGVVGFLSALTPAAHPESLFVWQVAVAAAARRRGVAGRLLRFVLTHPATAEVRFIEATVGPKNQASRALFQRLAAERGAPLHIHPGFDPGCFPGAHEGEDWLRVGPLDGSRGA